MTIKHWIMLLTYPVAVSIGQVMFKAAALRLPAEGIGLRALGSPMLIGAYVLWAGLSLFWLLIIRDVPLTRAYPFVALSFLFTPLLAWIAFGEGPDLRYALGIALIAVGVVLTQKASTHV